MDREAAELAEVAQAALESHPDDFSQEHERSMQAMSANIHSNAALGIYDGQPEGMPPAAVDQMGLDAKKRKKKKRRNKNQQQPDQ